jgi:hypothetical protein
MTEQATDKIKGEATKNSRLHVAIIILAIPVLAALFISGVIVLIVLAFLAFGFVVYVLSIVWILLNGHEGPS